MKINGNAIRPGNIIQHKNRLWVAVKTQHTQPGKGGAYLQVELKDIRDGTKLNERFRSSESVERVRLDEKDYQFLYEEGDSITVMDLETFDVFDASYPEEQDLKSRLANGVEVEYWRILGRTKIMRTKG